MKNPSGDPNYFFFLNMHMIEMQKCKHEKQT